jgi:hypothetical protein
MPGQAGGSDRLPVEQSTPLEPPDLINQPETARRGFWTGARQRTPFVEWTMRQTAFDALSRIGEPAVPKLVKLLDDPDPQLRAEAVLALARIGPEASGAVTRLTTLIEQDPEEVVRKNAVRALGQIGPAAASAVDVLIEQVRTGVEIPAANERPAGSVPGVKNPSASGRPTGSAAPTDAR